MINYCTYTVQQFIIRISFELEGHCLWVPLATYHELLGNVHDTGCFTTSEGHIFGPLSACRTIVIQASIVTPEWTILFIDHQRLITFHVMELKRDMDTVFMPGPGVSLTNTSSIDKR